MSEHNGHIPAPEQAPRHLELSPGFRAALAQAAARDPVIQGRIAGLLEGQGILPTTAGILLVVEAAHLEVAPATAPLAPPAAL